MRKTFVDTMTELAKKDDNLMLVIGDTGFSVFEGFEAEFPERFVNVGIAEQNFVAFSAGLAAMGVKVFAYNVVSFMTLRSMEQILLDVCYQENPVILVGVGGGLAYGVAGPTHHSCQDIAMMRSLPNMTVICPADPQEMRCAMQQAYKMDAPVYIRIGRSIDPPVHTRDIEGEFRIGKAIKLFEGEDVAIFSTGCMLKECVSLCEELKLQGITATLYSHPTVKPLDEEEFAQCAQKYKAVFTVEEHSKIGGFGSAVCEYYMTVKQRPGVFKMFALPDAFAPVTGTREYLLEQYKVDPQSMAKEIVKTLRG